jgi:hypothetical protein
MFALFILEQKMGILAVQDVSHSNLLAEQEITNGTNEHPDTC